MPFDGFGHTEPVVQPKPAPPPSDQKAKAIFLGLTAAACLAVMAAIAKVADTRGVSLVEILFYRHLLSLPLVLGSIAIGPGLRSIRTSRFDLHILRSVLGVAGFALYFAATFALPLADAMTIGLTAPIMATLLSALILREPTGAHRWTAVAIGFAGVLVTLQPGSSAANSASSGIMLALSAAIATASITMLLRKMGRTEPATTTVFWFTILPLVPASFVIPFFAQAHDPWTWAILAAFGLAGAVAQLAATAAYRLGAVSMLAPLDYTTLIWAGALGWLIWGTLPSIETALGALLIACGGLYIIHRERRLKIRQSLALSQP